MGLSLRPVVSSTDIPVLTKIHLDAFIRIPVNQAIWSNGITQAIVSTTERRNLKSFELGTNAQFLKVVDEDLDESIALAIWFVFETPEAEKNRMDLVAREWGPDANSEIGTEFWAGTLEARQTMHGKPHCFLSVLATAPAHHRRGAGSMLVKWGTDQADKRGVPCFLESSPEGLGLYRKHGFKEVGFFDTDIGTKRDGTNIYRHIVMMRDGKFESDKI